MRPIVPQNKVSPVGNRIFLSLSQEAFFVSFHRRIKVRLMQRFVVDVNLACLDLYFLSGKGNYALNVFVGLGNRGSKYYNVSSFGISRVIGNFLG
jgi:hypothetical protein